MKHHHWFLSALCLGFLFTGFTGNGTFLENIETNSLKAQVFANDIWGGNGGEAKLKLLETNTEDLHKEYTELIQQLSTLEVDKNSIENGVKTVEENIKKPTSWIQNFFTKIKTFFSKKNQDSVVDKTTTKIQEQRDLFNESLKDTQEIVSDKTEKLLEKKNELEEKIADIQKRYNQAKEASIRLREALLKMKSAANETNQSIKDFGDAFDLSGEEKKVESL